MTKAFHLLDGRETEVAMMCREHDYRYWLGEEIPATAAVLPYMMGATMLVLLPDSGHFPEVEARLSAELLRRIYEEAETRLLDLELPKLEMRYQTALADALQSLGLVDAFGASVSDFGGITPERRGLVISEVAHQAWVSVDEEGTEATGATMMAAALGEDFSVEPPEPVPFVVDRPYFFFIRDGLTGSLLFVGRVLDPGA